MALTAMRAGYAGIMVPADNSREAGVVQEISVLPVTHLAQVVDFYRGLAPIPPVKTSLGTLFSGAEQYADDFPMSWGRSMSSGPSRWRLPDRTIF